MRHHWRWVRMTATCRQCGLKKKFAWRKRKREGWASPVLQVFVYWHPEARQTRTEKMPPCFGGQRGAP